MEDFLPLENLDLCNRTIVETIGSNAVVKVLEGTPLNQFLAAASDLVRTISDSMVEENARIVLDITHALETKVSLPKRPMSTGAQGVCYGPFKYIWRWSGKAAEPRTLLCPKVI